MKFLIAGFGSIGRRHLRNLRALGEDDILLYRTHQSSLPEDEIAGLVVESDLQAALAHHPDAVIVANPTALHLAVAVPAAKAGCHLFLEKPVADRLECLGELEDALAQGGGQALVGFQFRFHPGLKRVRGLLQSGAVGRLVSARAHWGEYLPNWHPWEDYRNSYSARADLGGGVVFTLSHPFDYLRWLLGEVDSVQAQTGRLGDLDIPVEDTAEIIFRMASGGFATLHLDYLQRPPVHCLEIIGTEGTLQWDNATGCVNLFHASAGSWESFPAPEGFERNAMFLDEMRHFRDVIRGEAESICSLADGRRALELAAAIHESAGSEKIIHLKPGPPSRAGALAGRTAFPEGKGSEQESPSPEGKRSEHESPSPKGKRASGSGSPFPKGKGAGGG